MEKFNKYKHTSLITKWWLEDSKLSALLKIDRGYKLPSDWIKDLENANAFIFNNGIGEIRDILLGQKSKETEIFYYSPDLKAETNIAGQIIGWCLSREINKIRVKRLDVREDIITKELINNLILKTGVNQNETIHNKDSDIPAATANTISTTYSESANQVVLSTNAATNTNDGISARAITNTTTETADARATSTGAGNISTSEKSVNHNLHAKKSNLKRSKKQSERKKEQEAIFAAVTG